MLVTSSFSFSSVFSKVAFLRVVKCRYCMLKSQIQLTFQYHVEILAMEKEMLALQESANLFEVSIPDFKQLKQCRREIKLLKTLWDYVIIVQSSIDDWKTTPWKEINVEQMELDCKKFAKDIRSLDKEMRAWDTYIGVENTVKNMLTSLRAVSELQNPAIRERHWQQLMAATKVGFIY